MALEEASRMKLNKEELGNIGLSKFSGLHLWLKNDLSGLTSDIPKLEALEYMSLYVKILLYSNLENIFLNESNLASSKIRYVTLTGTS